MDDIDSYVGSKDYSFICYSHADSHVVLAEIGWLNDLGLNTWFDRGLRAGVEWTEEIGSRIESADRLLFFASTRSIASRHCRNEIHYALEVGKPIVVVFLESAELTRGLRLVLGSTQSISAHELTREEYKSRLLSALSLVESVPRRETAGTYIRRYRVPRSPTRFVNREQESADLLRMLDDESTRLVTVVGPGGIGKTRLGLKVAADREDHFPNGACFVSLTEVSSPTLVASAILDGLEVSRSQHDEPEDHLCRVMRERSLLLVLDNFEHLMDARLSVARILSHSPGSKMLISSRERLNVEGEAVYSVAGMAYPKEPAIEDLDNYGAIRLFVDRARVADPSFEITPQNAMDIVKICRMLDGHPLGNVLAAAWTKVLPCDALADEIAKNLDFLSSTMVDVPERHRSLRAVLEYSLETLGSELRKVFLKLSVFHGAFDHKAAALVAGASLPELAELLDKSLLQRDKRGFEVHEVLRQFSSTELAAHAEDSAQTSEAHSKFYANRLRERADRFRGRELAAALQETQDEFENVRAAWQWALTIRDVGRLLMMVQEIVIYFETQSRLQEALEFFDESIDKLGEKQPDSSTRDWTRLIGFILAAKALFEMYAGRYKQARITATNALDMLESTDAEMETGYCLYVLASLEQVDGEFNEALEKLTSSVDRLSDMSEHFRANHSRIALGLLYAWRGDHEIAVSAYEQAISVCSDIEDEWGRMITRLLLCETQLHLGRIEDARVSLDPVLSYLGEISDSRWYARCLMNVGVLSVMSGEIAEAKDQLLEAQVIAEDLGDIFVTGWCIAERAHISLLEGSHDDAQVLYESALQLTSQLQGAPVLRAVVLGFAKLFVIRGDARGAAAIVGVVSGGDNSTRTTELMDALITELNSSLGADETGNQMNIGLKQGLEVIVSQLLKGGSLVS